MTNARDPRAWSEHANQASPKSPRYDASVVLPPGQVSATEGLPKSGALRLTEQPSWRRADLTSPWAASGVTGGAKTQARATVRPRFQRQPYSWAMSSTPEAITVDSPLA